MTAKWSCNYLKFPKKLTSGYNTTTPWERENNNRETDDKDIFEFSVTDVSVEYGLTVFLGNLTRQIATTQKGARGPVGATSAQGRALETILASEDFDSVQAKEERSLQVQVQIPRRERLAG